MTGENPIEILVTIKGYTTKALLVFDGIKTCWLPVSQIEITEVSEGITVRIPEWLAIKKGLVNYAH